MSDPKATYGSKTAPAMTPKCPGCRGDNFDVSPLGDGGEMGYIVFCTGCGHIVGTVYNPDVRMG